MSGALGDAARGALRDALGEDGALLRFAEVVARQVAHPLGAGGEWIEADLDDDALDGDAREVAVARRLGAVLAAAARATGDDDAFDRAASELARDVALLSACYQNLDLVPAGGEGDAVAMLVARALERLDATPAH